MQKYKYCTKLHRYVQILLPLKTAEIRNAKIHILHKTAQIRHRYVQCTLYSTVYTAAQNCTNEKQQKIHKTTPTQILTHISQKSCIRSKLLKLKKQKVHKLKTISITHAQNAKMNNYEMCKSIKPQVFNSKLHKCEKGRIEEEKTKRTRKGQSYTQFRMNTDTIRMPCEYYTKITNMLILLNFFLFFDYVDIQFLPK